MAIWREPPPPRRRPIFPKYFIPSAAPAALAQIVEVASLVRVDGMDRVSATLRLAEKLNVASETVGDKYGRQLGLTTQQFDTLLIEPDLIGLSELLIEKFPRYESVIRESLAAIVSGSRG